MSHIENTSRKRVFVSYSHETKENADFVRNLAGQLRMAKFDVWLDEEQLSGGTKFKDAIKTAISQSDVGLFIVTERTDRDWTQYEIDLFASRPDTRRVAVVRDEFELGKLGPHLTQVVAISYPRDDPEPYARFWEIYCGVSGLPPGPRSAWEEKGRAVLHGGDAAPPPLPSEPHSSPTPAHGQIPLPCRARPVSFLSGDGWTFIKTDASEWVGVAPQGELHPPIPCLTESASAAIGMSDRLLVGLYESMVARLDGESWQFLPVEAPALSFGSSPDGDLAGTSTGGVIHIDDSGSAALFRIRDPVVAIASFPDGLLVIGSRGMFGRIKLPLEDGEEFKWIETTDLGRAVGFFQAAEQNRVGVFSAHRIGIFDSLTDRIIRCPYRFDTGIREILFFGAQRWPYGVLTDGNQLLLVDANLRSTRPVKFPHSEIVRGCCGVAFGEDPLAWTASGSLYRLGSGEAPLFVANSDVVLAYPAAPATIHIVRWNEANGATVELVRS